MNASTPSRLPFRLAAAATACAMLLLLFGGMITTMGAGMAVEGWMNAEGHFMPLFPIEKWFRDHGTFVEHTHRLIGIVVGLLMIALVVATHLKDSRRSARFAAWFALLAVCVQGALGGSRVLENSQGLAFLHGALGQLVFAILWCTSLYLMPSYQAAPTLARARGQALWTRGRAAALIVYAQIALGTWFRHSIRIATVMPGHDELPFPVGAFIAHGMGAGVVLVAVLVVGKAARDGWVESEDPLAQRLMRRLEVWIHSAFGMQFLLGIAALATLKMERTAAAPVAISTLHVLFGALTLAACTSSCLWGLRLMANAPAQDEGSEAAVEAAGA